MDSNGKGNIGEAKIIAYFLEQGYDVFTSFGTASKIDLVIHKDGLLQKVSVKATAYKDPRCNSWRVAITQSTRKGTTIFDNTKVDLLAVYIIPENRVMIFDAKAIITKRTVSIRMI